MHKIKWLKLTLVAVWASLFAAGCYNHVGGAKSSDSSGASGSAPPRVAVHISGNKLLNEQGKVIQLRGVSLMGGEYTAINGWRPEDPFGDSVNDSTWEALRDWHVNSIRITLNEISYLGIKCVTAYTGPAYNKPGKVQESDPGHNYRTRLKEIVDRATQEHFYVVLVLNYSAPNDPQNQVDQVSAQCATDFNPLPDRDHAIDFWTQIASAYKGYPNVLFELFDNPFINRWRYFVGTKDDAWKALRDGILINSYRPLWPTKKKHLWQSTGTQELLNTIRQTGARNIVLQCGLPGPDLNLWLTYKAVDSLNQTAVAWHAFSSEGSKWGDQCYSHPSWCDDRAYSFANTILSQGYPVVVTQFGDRSIDGTVGAPFASSLLPKLDAMGISYLAWTFTAGNGEGGALIKNATGKPTDGYGEYVKAHYACIAGLRDSCLAAGHSQSSFHSVEQQSSQPNVRGWVPSISPI